MSSEDIRWCMGMGVLVLTILGLYTFALWHKRTHPRRVTDAIREREREYHEADRAEQLRNARGE